MKGKRLFAYILAAAMLPVSGNAFAAENAKNVTYYVNQNFNSATTNTAPEDLTITSGRIRAYADGEKNKAILLYGDAENTANMGSENYFDDAVLSLDVKKAEEKKVNFKIGFYTDSNKMFSPVINIENDVIKTNDGKEIGGIEKSDYTHLCFVINNRKKVYDIYINGDRKANQWKIQNSFGGKLMIKRYVTGEKGEVIVDNVELYEGSEIIEDSRTEEKYSALEDAYINYNYANADHTFLDTDYISDIAISKTGGWDNMPWDQKTNKMTFNRIKYREDINRPNNYIIFEKTTPTDMLTDLYLEGEPLYPYYLIEGNLQVNKFGSAVRFAYVADRQTNSSRVDFEIIYVNESGQIILSSSGAVLKSLAEDEWFKYDVVLDTYNHCADVYINGKLMAEGVKYTEKASRPCFIRHTMNSVGTGKATFNKIRVVGMQKKYDPSGNDKSKFFSDDSGIEEYLKDKVAFFAYGKQICSNGKKYSRLENKPQYDSKTGELYVDANALSLGYGLDLKVSAEKATADGIAIKNGNKEITYGGNKITLLYAPYTKDGVLYVPVREFAAKALGHYVFENGNGLVITSQNKFGIDTSKDKPEALINGSTDYPYPYTNSRILEWYLTYERPSAEQIESDFNKTTDNGGMHPRVIMTKADFGKLREKVKTDETLKSWLKVAIESADSLLDKSMFTYSLPDLQRLDGLYRNWGGLDQLAFAYQMTGDKKYVDAIWRIFGELAAFPDWNPSHMIDPAEINGYVGIAYDWTYDAWTDEQRKFIYDMVKEKGLKDVNDAFYGRLYGQWQWANKSDKFVNWKSNFNTVINGGALTAAVAFAEEEPEFCFDLISNCIRSFEFTMINFAPCGVWSEGNDYWNYANHMLTKGLGSVLTATGQHYGLLDAQGTDQTALYYRSMDSYGGINNFHDSNPGRATSQFVGWFAKVFNQPELTLLRKQQIAKGVSYPGFWDIIYYPTDFNGESNLDYDYLFEGLDVVASRGSYTNEDEMYFSTHGGWVEGYHTQYDVSTFVFDMMGYRWAADLGKEDYNTRRDGGGASAFRDRAESHNVMVFNPTADKSKGQNAEGFAKLLDYKSKDRGMYVVYDLKDVYDNVAEYKRGFYVGDDRRSLTIRDEFTAAGTMDAYWFLMTAANVEIVDKNTAIMTIGGKKMKLELKTDVKEYELTVEEPKPLSVYPVLAGENKNEGYHKIQIKLKAENNVPSQITVKLSPYGEAASKSPVMDEPVAKWSIPDGEYVERPDLSLETIYINGRKMSEIETNGRVTIVDGEPLPTVTATPSVKGNPVEIIPGSPADDHTIVRVWNKDKTKYNDTYVLYQKSKSANLTSYEKLNIVNIEVSSTPEEDNHKANMTDGDYTTRWTSNNLSGEWALFDVGKVCDVSAVSAAFWRGNTRNYYFTLYVSEDGDNWTEVLKSQNSGETEGNELFEFNKQKARFVKLVGGGNTVNGHTNILEFAVLNKK